MSNRPFPGRRMVNPTKELSLQYMLLIYEDEAADQARTEEERRASIAAHVAFAR